MWEKDTYWTGPPLGFARRCQTRCWSEPRLPRTGEKGCGRERDAGEAAKAKSCDRLFIMWCLPVISVQAVHQFRKDARFDEIIDGGVTVAGQQLPEKMPETKAS